MIRDTSSQMQEIAAASQQQMAAIREINVGVSQLDEVVQQNAATASHQLAATSGDLSVSSRRGLQELVGFFREVPHGDDVTHGGLRASAAPLPAPVSMPPTPPRARRLPPPPPISRPPAHPMGDGPIPSHGGGQANGPAHPHGHGAPHSGGNSGRPGGGSHGGGIIIDLGNDDDFERPSTLTTAAGSAATPTGRRAEEIRDGRASHDRLRRPRNRSGPSPMSFSTSGAKGMLWKWPGCRRSSTSRN